MRKKDGIYNLTFGIVAQLATLLMGLLIPRLFMTEYGSEANGLVTSLNQIFVYASLLEAGVGVTSLQALYAPIAHNNTFNVSRVVAATDHYFKRTGIVYGFLVLLLSIGYPFLVNTELNYWTVFWIIISMGSFGVIRYFFQGKYTILLHAQGKTYITSNISTVGSILANVGRISLMLAGYNLIVVQLVYCVCNFLPMLYIAYYIRKKCAWLDLSVKPDFKALEQKYSVLLHSFSGMVFYNTSALILTIFCNLKIVSVYAMYALVFSMIGNIIGTVSNSITFALGQIFQVDRERYARLQDAWENYYLAFVFSLFTVALVLIVPFMKLYTSGVSDVNYILPTLPFLFFAVNILDYGRKTSSQIINFAGHFRKTQWRSFGETFINLTVSLVCVVHWGIYGVLFGTIAALLYRSNDMIIYANRTIMQRSAWPTYRRWLINLLGSIGFFVLTNLITIEIDDYFSFFLWGMLLMITSSLYFIILASFTDFSACTTASQYIRPILIKLHITH